MNIHFEEPRTGVLVIQPHFERLDALRASEFRAAALPRTTGRALVILDLSEVTGVDSTGLGVLVALLKSVRVGGHLWLTGVSRTVLALLGLTRLDRIFRSFESVSAALDADAEIA